MLYHFIINHFWKCFLFLFLTLPCFCFFSCSSDNNDEEPVQIDQSTIYSDKIQGIWELVGRRDRALSNEYKKEENYSKEIIFTKVGNNSGTYKMSIEDWSLSIKTTDEKENSYYIEEEKGSGKMILNMKFSHYKGDYWDSSYLEFADNYTTMYILKKKPTGYLDIDEMYKRK